MSFILVNWNLDMLVLVEGGKPENSERKTLVERREKTQPTAMKSMGRNRNRVTLME